MPISECVALGWLGIFETPIANQFCVEPTVHTEVYLLEKNPVHPRIQHWADFSGIYVDGRTPAQNRTCAKQRGQERQLSFCAHHQNVGHEPLSCAPPTP